MARPRWIAADDRIAELCFRHHLGEYQDLFAVHQCLGEMPRTNPADAVDCLTRACGQLGITGDQAADLVSEVAELGPTPAREQRTAPREQVA